MSRNTDTVRVMAAGSILAALDSGGTQSATEVDGSAVDTHVTGGIRFRKVAAAVFFDQTAGTSHRWGFQGNFQSRQATSGTGSTWADFGSTMSFADNTVTGTASGAAQYVYHTDYETLPTLARYVRLQYTPQGFIATSEAFSSATGGVADVAPVLLLSDPNKLPADSPLSGF